MDCCVAHQPGIALQPLLQYSYGTSKGDQRTGTERGKNVVQILDGGPQTLGIYRLKSAGGGGGVRQESKWGRRWESP